MAYPFQPPTHLHLLAIQGIQSTSTAPKPTLGAKCDPPQIPFKSVLADWQDDCSASCSNKKTTTNDAPNNQEGLSVRLSDLHGTKGENMTNGAAGKERKRKTELGKEGDENDTEEEVEGEHCLQVVLEEDIKRHKPGHDKKDEREWKHQVKGRGKDSGKEKLKPIGRGKWRDELDD
jgi:hypothetical protein